MARACRGTSAIARMRQALHAVPPVDRNHEAVPPRLSSSVSPTRAPVDEPEIRGNVFRFPDEHATRHRRPRLPSADAVQPDREHAVPGAARVVGGEVLEVAVHRRRNDLIDQPSGRPASSELRQQEVGLQPLTTGIHRRRGVGATIRHATAGAGRRVGRARSGGGTLRPDTPPLARVRRGAAGEASTTPLEERPGRSPRRRARTPDGERLGSTGPGSGRAVAGTPGSA